MPTYTATRDYRAERVDQDLTVYFFTKGDEVDLDEDEAAWVNNDAAGTLEPAKATKPAKKAPKPDPAGASTEAG